MGIVLSIIVGLIVLALLLGLNAYLDRKRFNREQGCDDQIRYYDKHHKHGWNKSEIKK